MDQIDNVLAIQEQPQLSEEEIKELEQLSQERQEEI